MADDFRLLVNFLRHEMAVVALINEERRGIRFLHLALHLFAGCVAHLHALAAEHRPITLFEVADGLGERRERDRIRAEIHLAFAVSDGEWRALARADQ